MRPVEKVQADKAKHQGKTWELNQRGKKNQKTIGKNNADSHQSKGQK